MEFAGICTFTPPICIEEWSGERRPPPKRQPVEEEFWESDDDSEYCCTNEDEEDEVSVFGHLTGSSCSTPPPPPPDLMDLPSVSSTELSHTESLKSECESDEFDLSESPEQLQTFVEDACSPNTSPHSVVFETQSDAHSIAYLLPHFQVVQHNPKARIKKTKSRVWVIDICQQNVDILDTKGNLQRSHSGKKLLQLEKSIMELSRCVVMFFDSSHPYSLLFENAMVRERFFECMMAARHYQRVWCPYLCGSGNIDTTTHIQARSCKVPIKVHVKQRDPTTGQVTSETEQVLPTRYVQTEGVVNASKLRTEPVSVWVGTFNLGGHEPPLASQMSLWMCGGYDLYAVCYQNACFRTKLADELEVFRALQRSLGKSYIIVSQMILWDTCLCVIVRKPLMTKITNVEGTTHGVKDIVKFGPRGGCLITFKYLETSLAFVGLHLPNDSNQSRIAVLREVLNSRKIANTHLDFTSQFHYVWLLGDFGSRLNISPQQAQQSIQAQAWSSLVEHDELTQQLKDGALLQHFQEHELHFRPVGEYKLGSLTIPEKEGHHRMRSNSEKTCNQRLPQLSDVLTKTRHRFSFNLSRSSATSPPQTAANYSSRILFCATNDSSSLPSDSPGPWLKMDCTGYRVVQNIRIAPSLPVCGTWEIECLRPYVSLFQPPPSQKLYFTSLSFELDHKCPSGAVSALVWCSCGTAPQETASQVVVPVTHAREESLGSSGKANHFKLKTSTFLSKPRKGCTCKWEEIAPIILLNDHLEFLETQHVWIVLRKSHHTPLQRRVQKIYGCATLPIVQVVHSSKITLPLLCCGLKVGTAQLCAQLGA
eukprot:TRINITY_DN103911_c0_g1_i1.p1 TRINITY_DN103911_c0_g1~~TRINITY_DN103911_c0_g1_i1.p1  ORF type:complete len:821 (-),score=48.69 TRINITY_DN103911_c0_g1_i1:60-2522(-)